MNPFEVYKTYLALKNHFTKPEYDYQKYCGKVKANLQSFYKRRDRFFYEKISRNKDDHEIIEFFVSNFVSASDPANLWIGSIIREGDKTHKEWQKRQQSLSYQFKEQSEELFKTHKFEDVFNCTKGHPPVLKMFLSGKISLETLVIYDRIFMFRNKFDKKLMDPVWETVSLKIKKYNPFLNIDVFRYRKILKEIIVGDA